MDIDEKYKAVDKFLEEIHLNKKSDVICPICKTPLKFTGNSSCYEVVCQTPNCLRETFRGI